MPMSTSITRSGVGDSGVEPVLLEKIASIGTRNSITVKTAMLHGRNRRVCGHRSWPSSMR